MKFMPAVAEAEDIRRPMRESADARRRKVWDFVRAAVAEGSELSSVRRCGGKNAPTSAIAEGWNFRGSRRCGCADEWTARFQRLPTADQGYSRQPIRWRREWNWSRYGGREIGWRADTAEGTMVPGADFNCFSVKFWAILQLFLGLKMRKVVAG